MPCFDSRVQIINKEVLQPTAFTEAWLGGHKKILSLLSILASYSLSSSTLLERERARTVSVERVARLDLSSSS